MPAEKTFKMIHDHKVKFIDLRFCTTSGREQHITLPAHCFKKNLFVEGRQFETSLSPVRHHTWNTGVILMPDPLTAVIDPFFNHSTLVLRCDIIDPLNKQASEHDPRSLGKRAEAYLQTTGIADCVYFGPENEFFLLDFADWRMHTGSAHYKIDAKEACWNSVKVYEEGNKGHRPGLKGGCSPVPPTDSLQDLRSGISSALKKMGMAVESHDHEVASAGQCELSTRFDTLVNKADQVLALKYVVNSIARRAGKTATFMPKPFVGDNGNGMHVHLSLAKNGVNLFAGDHYAGLSETALFYIGGIVKHAQALNAFTNASTNSYKRLIPDFDAPVALSYSALNRSAAIRIPHTTHDKDRRIEIRFPDSSANPYFAFAALLMAGLDGIQHKIHPGDAIDKDMYRLSPVQTRHIPHLCHSLEQALDALNTDRDFLIQGDVFSHIMIDSYIQQKMEDVTRIRSSTHACEFEMYFSL